MGMLRFLWEDLKSDVRTVRKMARGEAKFAFSAEEFFENIGEAAKECYPWFLMVLFAFLCGFLVASQFYEKECNEHILEVFYPWYFNDSLRPVGLVLEYGINFSEVFGDIVIGNESTKLNPG